MVSRSTQKCGLGPVPLLCSGVSFKMFLYHFLSAHLANTGCASESDGKGFTISSCVDGKARNSTAVMQSGGDGDDDDGL